MSISASGLIAACRDTAVDAGLHIHSSLEPLGGEGSPIKPAVYEGGVYQHDRRWPPDGRAEPVDVLVVDNVPSQANRLEAALERHAGWLGLPRVVLDLSGVGALPPHLPATISGFRFPHRHADAYLRDSMLDGTPFQRTEIGRRLRDATSDHPAALLEWFPQALLFGFWQSHLAKGQSQAKLARSWISETVGYEPATTETRQLGLKGDPLNLSVEQRVQFDESDRSAWELTEEARGGGRGERLSELGHGQVPISVNDAAPGGVSFASIEQQATLSLAGLRRLTFGAEDPRNAPARAVVAAIGLFAHAAAFDRAFSLRSGCDLRSTGSTWTWLGEAGDTPVDPLDVASARELLEGCAAAAEEVGLPVGSAWPSEPLVVEPHEQLSKAIRKTYPEVDS
ncbi:type I-U CRISPR-associated protein Cas7 [Egibacter rhizosphaerae]|uniref:Type I-U CRISPR-associated protein Cas7 n=1 Tax=Egibacter rhizosphaerae TaxID=1670831 RepID=A0A411YEU6_9ACTN|nr:type I-U CRISPR-associated RAMP protein Csb1/Cas7u [Egibacter rhizosphaerae]QBI19642.1 type I-U CRISPR-associated protein Cas7 [Egibacter rhizosphaerae]